MGRPRNKGRQLRYVYFPNSGVASITMRLSEGRVIEAATVGDEGTLGVEAFLGDHAVACGQTLMQVAGTNAAAMHVDDFRRELARRGTLHELMGRYTQVLIAQVMQSAACNAIHGVHQRCARWLLMTHDRMHEQDSFRPFRICKLQVLCCLLCHECQRCRRPLPAIARRLGCRQGHHANRAIAHSGQDRDPRSIPSGLSPSSSRQPRPSPGCCR